MSIIIKNLENFYDYLLNSKTILGSVITLSLFLYGGLASSKLPKKFKDLFNNFLFILNKESIYSTTINISNIIFLSVRILRL